MEFGNWLKFQGFFKPSKKPDSPRRPSSPSMDRGNHYGEEEEEKEVGVNKNDKGKEKVVENQSAEKDLLETRDTRDEGTSSWNYDLNTIARMDT